MLLPVLHAVSSWLQLWARCHHSPSVRDRDFSVVAQGIQGQGGKSAAKKALFDGDPALPPVISALNRYAHSILNIGAATENRKEGSLPSRVHRLVDERGKKANMAKHCVRVHGSPKPGP